MNSETFDFGPVEVTVAVDAGPRILGFARLGGPQLFADLSDVVIEQEGAPFRFLGGHRLWRAPEVPAVTYQPDDVAVTIDRDGGRVSVTGPPDIHGVVKEISLTQHGDRTVVDHRLRNTGDGAVTLAPWAITALATGGVAVVPVSGDLADPDGALPNRSVALWPYTDPDEVGFGADLLTIEATSNPTRTKIGTQNRRGWLAYVLKDEVFVKWSPLHRVDADYPDLGSSVEVYRDDRFIELESLGPLVTLGPGEEVHHREVWAVFPADGADVVDIAASITEDPMTQ
ncbi:MAG: hypothetical protein HKN01_06475 [Acidimicrobiia bacterium]|nr:hypothetical protein [Acidimicrobiia bacterium]